MYFFSFIFFLLFFIFFTINWPNISQNFQYTAFIEVLLLSVAPLIAITISLISMSFFAKNFLSRNLKNLADDLIASYTDELDYNDTY
jgi:hypothetical protein